MKQLKQRIFMICVLGSTVFTLLMYPYIHDKANSYTLNEQIAPTAAQSEELANIILGTLIPRYYELKLQEDSAFLPYEIVLSKQDIPKENFQGILQNINTTITYWLRYDDIYLNDIKYYVKNDLTNRYVTNSNVNVARFKRLLNEEALNDPAWYLALRFDHNGKLSILAASSSDMLTVDEHAFKQAVYHMFERFDDSGFRDDLTPYFTVNGLQVKTSLQIRDTSFVFYLDEQLIEQVWNNYGDHVISPQGGRLNGEMIQDEAGHFIYYDHALRIYLAASLMILLIVWYGENIPKEKLPCFKRFERIPLEFHGIAYLLSMIAVHEIGGELLYATTNGMHIFSNEAISSTLDLILLWVLENGALWALLYGLVTYWMSLIKTIAQASSWKEHSLLMQGYAWMKTQGKRIAEDVKHTDLRDPRLWRILVYLIVHYLMIALLILCWQWGWEWGMLSAFLYLCFGYMILRKLSEKIMHDYQAVLEITNELAQGKVDRELPMELGLFTSMKEPLCAIRQGFGTAVEKEVHSQRMKTELITNVSHDLKTPLTNIITYVDLLKQKELTAEEQTQYVEVLERNSQRLKQLINDLFDLSKANSHTMKLELLDVDVVSLMNQVLVECAEALRAQGLDIRFTHSDDKIICPLDSLRTYRIFENLVMNIAKYALKQTRVYIEITDFAAYVDITLRNISAVELHVDPSDLTERFTRGDASRNSEGSGLGLAIVKSFTEIQGGTMHIQIDGDLFKVILRLPKQSV